ncbi:MAG: hypothetical protein P4L93_10950 [Coriobacteriia bacterium]|nr:hypothetical protein [Coriobacteriia bacterium]
MNRIARVGHQPNRTTAAACLARSHARPRRFTGAPLALVSTLALALVLLAPTSALAISRDSVLARAQSWVDAPVKYSQSKHYLGYRTDCSGYVSMCWKTGTSWSTSSFHAVTYKIKTSQLRPGDAMLKKGYHIRLFYGWVDDAHTQYVAYEANTMVAVCRIHSIADDLHAKYVPTRYKKISGNVTATNLLKNSNFNTWAQSWGSQPQLPVWWQVDGPRWQTLVAHRLDVFRSTHNALQLINPSDDPTEYTVLSQSAPVAAGAGYRLTAWATNATDPHGLELWLTYLDASGQPLAQTNTAGDAAGIGSSGFTSMSLASTAPSSAVSAVASVRLAGSEDTSTAGGYAGGSSALLDDITLLRQ